MRRILLMLAGLCIKQEIDLADERNKEEKMGGRGGTGKGAMPESSVTIIVMMFIGVD